METRPIRAGLLISPIFRRSRVAAFPRAVPRLRPSARRQERPPLPFSPLSRGPEPDRLPQSSPADLGQSNHQRSGLAELRARCRNRGRWSAVAGGRDGWIVLNPPDSIEEGDQVQVRETTVKTEEAGAPGGGRKAGAAAQRGEMPQPGTGGKSAK